MENEPKNTDEWIEYWKEKTEAVDWQDKTVSFVEKFKPYTFYRMFQDIKFMEELQLKEKNNG